MTNIEQKALELVNEVLKAHPGMILNPSQKDVVKQALCQSIEQHEAYKQEVSDAVEHFKRCYPGYQHASLFDRFIIAKPDPLVDAVKDILNEDSLHEAEEFSDAIRAALAKRGLEIREKGE